MLERKLRGKFSAFLALVARKLISIGVTANMITLIGFCVNVVAAVFLATGRLVLAGVLILFGGIFDMMDGAVARVAPKSNASGALLDSVIDRYSEGAVFLGALIYFYTHSNFYGVILVFAAMIGSILVSYVRARAEGLRIECKVGFMQRPERIALLAFGTLLQGVLSVHFAVVQSTALVLTGVIAILAITSHITAVHRLVFSLYELSNRSRL
jgi:CDP-diacylglycerol--glycerol-3-phosphate 3-phosphatidyltransferase